MPSGICQTAHSVTSGVPSTNRFRQWPRVSPIRTAPPSMMSAGGRTSNIVISHAVVIFIAFQDEAESLGKQHHCKTGQEAEHRAKAEPAVGAEVAFNVDEQLRDDCQSEHGGKYPPQLANGS